MKCHVLSVDLKNKKMESVAVQDKYRDGMKGETEREKRAHRRRERITYSEKELGKTGRDDIEKYALLKTNNKDLECSKRRAENEIEVRKKRFSNLETRVFRMEEENSTLRCIGSQVCGNIELEIRGLQNEDSHNDEGEIHVKDGDEMSKLQAEITSTGTNSSQVAHLQTKENVLNTNEESNSCSKESKSGETMKCHVLSVDLENKKTECVAVQDKYRDGMKGETEREKRAHKRRERITYSEEELGKTGRDGIEKYVLLKTDNKDLECSKRGVEDEIEVCKKRISDLETQVFGMEEENSTLRCIGSPVCGNIELEMQGLQNEVSHNDEGEICVKDIDEMSKNQAEITSTGTNSSQVAHLQTKEKVLITNEQIRASAFPGSPSIDMLCEPSMDVVEMEKNTPLESKVEFRYNVRKQQVLALEGSSNQRQSVLEPGSVRPASDVHTIEISDSDDSLERSSDNENDLISKKCLKRKCLDQRDEEYESSCKKDFPFMSIQKPNRASGIVSSESESNDEVEELQDNISKPPPSNVCSETCNVSCRGKNVEKKNGWAERTSQNECTSPNHLETSGMAYDGESAAEDGKERKNIVEEVHSDSDGKSLSAISLEGSDSLDTDSVDSSSDSEDSEDFHSVLDKALAMIFRRRDKELKWKIEADMLHSFEEDPELCMKAVCALYRQQKSEENPKNGFLQCNNRGFDKFDALRGTTLAEFLMDGDRKGDLKKSVKELEIFDPKALEECKRLARHYSEQLFKIYQSKEDSFFLPSSTGC